ncbi:MAG TPA: hypothetical protein VMF61_09390 [Candidatus Acidoferrales bacterium]|nr:hypothetical protein [Candidatus Acidoferrales bacterium]
MERMDPLQLAEQLPRLAERSMRSAILAATASRNRNAGSLTARRIVGDALVRFERASLRVASDGIRPALLFAERDRIVKELRRFLESRLAGRLFRIPRRNLLAVGRAAAPFDALVRGRAGGTYGVVFCRLASDGRRLEAMRSIRTSARRAERAVRGVLVYDFVSGSVRTLRGAARAAGLSAA